MRTRHNKIETELTLVLQVPIGQCCINGSAEEFCCNLLKLSQSLWSNWRARQSGGWLHLSAHRCALTALSQHSQFTQFTLSALTSLSLHTPFTLTALTALSLHSHRTLTSLTCSCLRLVPWAPREFVFSPELLNALVSHVQCEGTAVEALQCAIEVASLPGAVPTDMRHFPLTAHYAPFSLSQHQVLFLSHTHTHSLS